MAAVNKEIVALLNANPRQPSCKVVPDGLEIKPILHDTVVQAYYPNWPRNHLIVSVKLRKSIFGCLLA